MSPPEKAKGPAANRAPSAHTPDQTRESYSSKAHDTRMQLLETRLQWLRSHEHWWARQRRWSRMTGAGTAA
jgi:hypothetical protein